MFLASGPFQSHFFTVDGVEEGEEEEEELGGGGFSEQFQG